MKKSLCTIVAVLAFSFTQAQTLNDVFSSLVQPQSNTTDLREGLKQIEAICEATPQEKCNKAKASANYLLADRYFEAAHEVLIVDPDLVDPILQKAKFYYKKAEGLMPIENFSTAQKRMLIENKSKIEANPVFKTL
jgi:hypothetical protein